MWINDVSLIRRQQGDLDLNNLYQELRGDETMFMRVYAKNYQESVTTAKKYQQTNGRVVVLVNPEVAILDTTSAQVQ